ncbi:hypothetical protein ACHAW6_010516 [Cyclotella cf. meneghiniana]
MCLPVQSISFKTMAGECNSSTKISHCLSDHIMTVSVPTFVERADAQIEVTNLNSSDISSLKANDPFMYYSIPAARNAAMKGKEVDPSLLHADGPSSTSSSTRTGKAPKISFKVRRERRVSTECHPDLLLDQMLCDSLLSAAAAYMPSEDDDLEDYFLSFLEKITQ